ncbi:MAG: type VII toxin-antitoxin system MntA family adenylyltransferase antitoxin [Clostridium sp.]
MFKEDYNIEGSPEEITSKIKEYLYNRADISLAYIFGSFDTEEFTSTSDVDIAILGFKDISYTECLRLNSELEDIIGLPIDLNHLPSLPEYIQVQVVMGNRQLFSKDDYIEEKYLDKLNHWIKTEFPLWKKLMLGR